MIVSKYRQELDEDSLKLPGLMLLGHNISSKAGNPLELHVHEGCIEIVVILKGNESYCVENQLYALSGGDVFITYVSQPHQSGGNLQGICEIIWLQIDTSVQQDFLGLSRQLGDMIREKLLMIDTHIMKTDKEGMSLLKKSLECFLKLKTENRLYAQSLLIGFLSRLLFTQNQFKKGDELIGNILKYIEANIYDVINIENICSIFGISLSGFKHKFKDYTGVTPRDYINDKKIQKAKELLKSGKSVTETALQLSFNSSDYFSVVFKKYTLCSPTKFVGISAKTTNKIDGE